MSIGSLPDASSPSLGLVHPNEKEIQQQHAANASMWRGALSHDAYFRREAFLRSQGIAQNDGLTYWVLVDTSLPPSERKVLCGCETIRKRALVAGRDGVSDVLCHGIGSVFCPKEHRGRGYAQRMMKELGQILRTWQSEQASNTKVGFSILYSDIGRNFYAKLGWKVFPSSHISLPGMRSDPALFGGLPSATPLQAPDLPELCLLDEQYLREKLSRQSEAGKPAVALIPDTETLTWHHAREEFVGQELHDCKPSMKGAIVRLPSGQRAWCYWTRMWYNPDPTQSKDNTLHILRIVVEERRSVATNGTNVHTVNGHGTTDEAETAAIQALLLAAQEQAYEWKMETVELWNPTSTALAAVRRIQEDAVVVDRAEESIASLMWYGDEQDVTWEGNEKYGWC